jgi:hypothetical protein
MRARFLVTVTIIAAVVCGISAQTTTATADGVAALARGDYPRAVEILKPIAEDWRSQDTAAQFFMGGMYETGHGVPADPLRACALYERAASNFDQPFGKAASAPFAAAMSRGQEFSEECQTLAVVGLNNGFEPVTFHLGPGHSIEWTLAAATVTYDGRTNRTPTILKQPGARFLPLKYTELSTGPTRSLERHFIEAFFWTPTQTLNGWDLQWHAFEVIRDEIIRIDTSEPLLTVEGDAPPARDTFDVREYAAVRVNDDGNAEWTVLKGPHAGSGRIESDAERREERETEAARDAALKKVDWSKRSDVHRQPAMTYVDSEGCGYFQLVGWTADHDEVIVVRANPQNLGLSTGAATFDLTRSSSNISIEAYVYDAPQRRFNFCTDVIIREQDSIEPEVWRAVAGTISIELSPPGARGPRATVTLSNVVLRNSAGTTVTVSRPVKLSAIVGAVFG